MAIVSYIRTVTLKPGEQPPQGAQVYTDGFGKPYYKIVTQLPTLPSGQVPAHIIEAMRPPVSERPKQLAATVVFSPTRWSMICQGHLPFPVPAHHSMSISPLPSLNSGSTESDNADEMDEGEFETVSAASSASSAAAKNYPKSPAARNEEEDCQKLKLLLDGSDSLPTYNNQSLDDAIENCFS